MADGEADIDGGTRAKAGVGNTDPHGEFGLPKTLRQNDDLVDVYVGAGCFWHIQHELVKWEQTVLGRSPDEITAVVGYAGAALVDGGGNTQKAVCYNTKDETDYGAMGHTEVVAIKVPKSRLEAFLRDVFFRSFLHGMESVPTRKTSGRSIGARYFCHSAKMKRRSARM